MAATCDNDLMRSVEDVRAGSDGGSGGSIIAALVGAGAGAEVERETRALRDGN